MADWNTPSLTTIYTSFLAALTARDVDVATQFNNGTPTNTPTGAIKWNASTNRWNIWSGTAWNELTATYGLTSLVVNGTFQVTGATGTTPATGFTWGGGWQNFTAGLQINGNTLAAATGSLTYTLPASSDTLVGRNTTDTLTNKTIRTMTSVISANTTAVASTTYVLTASCTLTLPASPTAGDWVEVANLSGTTTAVVARNGSNIQGSASDLTIDILNAAVILQFADATRGWVIL